MSCDIRCLHNYTQTAHQILFKSDGFIGSDKLDFGETRLILLMLNLYLEDRYSEF